MKPSRKSYQGKKVSTSVETIQERSVKEMEAKKAYAGYDPKVATGDILNFVKYSADTVFESIEKVQQFNKQILKDIMESGRKVQEDSAKIADQFTVNLKKGRDEYLKIVEAGFKRVEELL